ncbi:MAG: hypothetical protein KGZ87_04880 [Bacteroidetes bacterium]|nr:hypothetical protein [Bacteroidota bacterium]
MNKLKIHFENCFGIKKLETEFVFNESNKVNAVYAKNGLMKTSFAKVFKKIQDGKESDIKDEIFNQEPIIKNITIDDKNIEAKEIFVIRSFERAYESASISSLLINDEIKEKLSDVLDFKSKFLKNLEKISGVKELEDQIFKDFGFSKNSFLDFVNEMDLQSNENLGLDLKYSEIFDGTNLETINSNDFQNNIQSFLTKSNDIFNEYKFLDKGNFSFPKLAKVQKELNTNSFFVNQNSITLNNDLSFKTPKDFETKIKEIETKLTDSKEMKAIQKSLSTVKGTILRELLEKNPLLINELKKANLISFKKKVWCSYFSENQEALNNLKIKYHELKKEISNLELDNTAWKEAINIFNDRFTLPFKMEIENMNSCIIGESLPKVVFKFCSKENQEDCSENDWVFLNRGELEAKETLSQGESRALYLLNIIFDIQKRQKEKQKTLFVIDDIADSFDYKNKYAIIEYLNDISNVENFYLIVLSHNFDFYRTVSSRLAIKEKHKFIASGSFNKLSLINESLKDENPFKKWKGNLVAKNDCDSVLCKKHFISLIPFVRNLIEFGRDNNVINDKNFSNDIDFLTTILHQKELTKQISVSQLKSIYKHYLNIIEFDSEIVDEENVYDLIINLSQNWIESNNNQLENKLILAISTRLYAEDFMKSEIKKSTITYSWKDKKTKIGTSNEFLDFIAKEYNQTRKLFDGFKQLKRKDQIKILESVNIMTPENIHINSFMYEPILDMDINELKNLHKRVCELI